MNQMDDGRTVDQLMSGIEHLLDDFDRIGRFGVETYRRYDPAFLVDHDDRAAACCIYSHMLAEAARRLDRQPGITPVDVRGLKVWLVGDAAVIRFKKTDEDGRSRTYPTKQARSYDRGELLPGLPPPAARLTVGYLLDEMGTTVRRVQVSRPNGKRVAWCAAIVPTENSVAGQLRWQDVTKQRSLGDR